MRKSAFFLALRSFIILISTLTHQLSCAQGDLVPKGKHAVSINYLNKDFQQQESQFSQYRGGEIIGSYKGILDLGISYIDINSDFALIGSLSGHIIKTGYFRMKLIADYQLGFDDIGNIENGLTTSFEGYITFFNGPFSAVTRAGAGAFNFKNFVPYAGVTLGYGDRIMYFFTQRFRFTELDDDRMSIAVGVNFGF
jgi:hypothetical protein